MEIGTAIIIAGIVNIFGMILFMYTRDLQWFKKENFKIQKSALLAENRIKVKKLERELGISSGRKTAASDNSLLDSLKGLDLGKIQGLLDLVQKDEEPSGEGSIMDGLLEFAKSNPEAVQNFLSNMTNKKDDGLLYQT